MAQSPDPKYIEKWFKDKDSKFRDIQFAAFDPAGEFLALGAPHAILLVSVKCGDIDIVVRRRDTTVTAISWDMHQIGIVVAYTDGVILNACRLDEVCRCSPSVRSDSCHQIGRAHV